MYGILAIYRSIGTEEDSREYIESTCRYPIDLLSIM